MQPERLIAHEERCLGRPLTEEEVLVLKMVGALAFGGKQKRAKAMRKALSSITRRT